MNSGGRCAGVVVMDHHTSGQHSHSSQAPGFQWLSFAYQGLTEIPYDILLEMCDLRSI